MYWVISLVGALLVGALLTYLLSAVFGRGDELPPAKANPWAEQHRAQLEQQDITADAVEDVAFTQSLRGYNAAEVDRYLQRITAKLRDYEHQNGTAEPTGAQTATSTQTATTEEHAQ